MTKESFSEKKKQIIKKRTDDEWRRPFDTVNYRTSKRNT